ncbi:MAG: isoamylase early set domain-containing protein [Nitrospirae bacterium]|nr:isoamylase early set domain-containing protein [Nitrospirota bacterium]
MTVYRKKRQTAAADKNTKKLNLKEITNEAIPSVKVENNEETKPVAAKPPVKENKVKEKQAVIKKDVAASGFKKVYIEDTNICRVTFTLQKEAAPDAATVAIAGDFNSWDSASHMMRRSRNGNFTITLDLEAEKDYQFKYLIDGTRWENDWKADRYDGDNSVVVV